MAGIRGTVDYSTTATTTTSTHPDLFRPLCASGVGSSKVSRGFACTSSTPPNGVAGSCSSSSSLPCRSLPPSRRLTRFSEEAASGSSRITLTLLARDSRGSAAGESAASRTLSLSLASDEDLRGPRCIDRQRSRGDGDGEVEVATVLWSLPSLLVGSAAVERFELSRRRMGLSENLAIAGQVRPAARARRSEAEVAVPAAHGVDQ